MLFNNHIFALFALIVFALYFTGAGWKWRKLFLLVMSYIFYAAWNAPYLLLIIFSTIVDFFAAKGIYRARSDMAKKLYLGLSLVANLGVLTYFKYGNFLLENSIALAARFGIAYEPMPWSILLPVGISFYTFQTLSYSLDIYKGRLKPSDSFLDFALFVTFFPQLVAGPIVRARKFMPQLIAPPVVTAESFGWGLILVVIGLFEKVVIADGLTAPIADRIFAQSGTLPPGTVVIGLLAFVIQILCDFAGYSLVAIGIARCLGFELPQNFRAPYAAIGYADLWQRWHISMSSWFRDYLYANVRSTTDRSLWNTIRTQMITMTLIGLWHGASWTFVVWGAFNGAVLSIETMLKKLIGHWHVWSVTAIQVLLGGLTFALFAFSGILFRSRDLAQATDLARSFFAPTQTPFHVGSGDILIVLALTAATLAFHTALRKRRFEQAIAAVPASLQLFLLVGMMSAIIMIEGDSDAFIYFQF
ncbi:hypothetical protein TQ29_10570 [Actibacterium sp. EMB200-NS6]|nr:hypothetical protein TQ29_10570 [Actibacterium sp. EMB200-NS6]